MVRLLLAGLAVAVAWMAQWAYADAESALQITTTACPHGVQNQAYVGCTIEASGGAAPFRFSIDGSHAYPPLPEGLWLDPVSGLVSGEIGGQGVYFPLVVVTDSAGARATRQIRFAIHGANAFLATIFPSNSIFHHRVDAATTGLPVDTSPAAPIFFGDLSATIKPYFGSKSDFPFPFDIPVLQVPADQPNVPVTTTEFQSYFTSAPIPRYAPVEKTRRDSEDRHVLIYRSAGAGTPPALYEMWVGIRTADGWTNSGNAFWPDVTSNQLTPQGKGTADAAGLPIAPLLVNADEVLGSGSRTTPNGVIKHPIRFTVSHFLNNWVWPATESGGGVGSCTSSSGATIRGQSLISQASPPASCTVTGPPGEIYRLKTSVPTPACAATSPEAAIIITAFRNYGIIIADNGVAGGLIGTPDARWVDDDLACLSNFTLANFEPVNVSSLMVSNDSGQTSK